MEPRCYQVVLWLVFLQLHTKYASIVQAQPGCKDPVFFERWWGAWLVNYNPNPCDHNSQRYAFCEDSGWGEEEATVVCREQGYSHGISGYLPAYQGAAGYSHIECEGTETALEQCSFASTALYCSSVGVVTVCYNEPGAYIPHNYLTVSEGESAEVCIVLSGQLMENAHIVVETSDNTSAVANYDYIPVSYTLTFGPSYQSEQCIEIQIINDSLAEGWEKLTVQLTTNSSAIDLATTHFDIYIEQNNGSNRSDICENGSISLVSGMDGSSLQLVEMCSEGVWSPVCDHNWTVADATVACSELGYQGTAVPGALESKSPRIVGIPNCQGNEARLADCFQRLEDSINCHYVLVDCGVLPSDPEDPDSPNDDEDDNERTGSENEDSENRGPNNGASDDEIDSEDESEDAAASSGPSAGATAGVATAVVLTVMVMVVVIGTLVVVLVWWKRRVKKLPPTDSNGSSSSQPAVDNEVQTQPDIHFDNPVYSSGVEFAEPSQVDPEHNLINPLYEEAVAHNSQSKTEALTGHEYAVLEEPHSTTGEVAGGGASDYNHGIENGYTGDCQHTAHESL